MVWYLMISYEKEEKEEKEEEEEEEKKEEVVVALPVIYGMVSYDIL